MLLRVGWSYVCKFFNCYERASTVGAVHFLQDDPNLTHLRFWKRTFTNLLKILPCLTLSKGFRTIHPTIRTIAAYNERHHSNYLCIFLFHNYPKLKRD